MGSSLSVSSQGRNRRGASKTTSERCRDTPKQIQGQVYKCRDLQTGKRRLRTWYLLGGYGELGLEPRDPSGVSCHSLQSGLWLRPTVVRSAPHVGRCVHGGLKLTAYTEGREEALFRGAESTSSVGRPRSPVPARSLPMREGPSAVTVHSVELQALTVLGREAAPSTDQQQTSEGSPLPRDLCPGPCGEGSALELLLC